MTDLQELRERGERLCRPGCSAKESFGFVLNFCAAIFWCVGCHRSRTKNETCRSTEAGRGVFEKEPGSGAWWIQYIDADGRRRRGVGTRGNAIDAVRKRKAGALQWKKLPEKRQARTARFADLAEDAEA